MEDIGELIDMKVIWSLMFSESQRVVIFQLPRRFIGGERKQWPTLSHAEILQHKMEGKTKSIKKVCIHGYIRWC